MPQVDLVLLDVNETLSDMAPVADRFASVGAPAALAPTWFAAVLRDGFALAALDRSATFRDVAAAVLRTVLAPLALTVPVEEAVASVLEGFSALPVHPDVAPGLHRLREHGVRVATLSNGAASVAEGLLERAGLADLVEAVLSVEDAGRWKPHPRSYAYALDRLGAAADRTALVAVHPWDLAGAQAAGMVAAWLRRGETGPWPAVFAGPDVEAVGLDGVADTLKERAQGDDL